MTIDRARRAVKTQLRRVDEACRQATASLRALPDFLIIGEAKCGTTSLYDNLVRHPHVISALRKEVHFFDLRFHLGLTWYRANFPLQRRTQPRPNGSPRRITGEASPYYMYHPHAPRRIKEALPRIKAIAMLRNPIERAYSHYQHEVKNHRETRSFDEAIAQEPERLRGEQQRMLDDDRYNSVEHRRRSYVARGIYVDQLAAWLRHFDRSQLLVIRAEDYFCAPDEVFSEVLQFLGVPAWRPESFFRKNTGSYEKISPDARQRLASYYAPHNQRLADLLGKDFRWR